MFENFIEVLRKDFPIDFTRNLLVGVSGGPDSLCLLDLLHKAGLPLVVAHLNHRLRPEADQDAAYVRQVAQGYGIPYVEKIEHVAEFAQNHSLSVEEAARNLRYRFLFAEAAHCGAQAVAVGHTADDQVETVLMHLLRGAGLEGLKGMEAWQVPNAWSKTIALARPLLETWREETEAYCREHDLRPVIDLTNLERTYYRNRLRHDLLPVLEAYSLRLKEKLVRMAKVLSGDQQVLASFVETAWQACLRKEGPGFVAFERKVYDDQPAGIQRRLLRKGIASLRSGLRDVGFETVERALEFLRQPNPNGQVDLTAGLRLFIEGELAWIAAWEADLPEMGWPQMTRAGESVRMFAPAHISLADLWKLSLELVEDFDKTRGEAFENPDPYQTWLDADQLEGSIEVRGRREGDFIKPLGMEGHRVKLADLMINVKMPQRAREGWPLVVCGEEVVWVPGYATSHTSRVKADSKKVYYLKLKRQE